MKKKSGLADNPLFALPGEFGKPVASAAGYRGARKRPEQETKSPQAKGNPPQEYRSPEVVKSRTHGVQKSRSSVVKKSSTPEVVKSRTHGVQKFEDYPLLHFRDLEKMDVFVTGEQLDYLKDLESVIVRGRPGMEKGNPLHQRLTKTSVVRALVEIIRRLDLTVDPQNFNNERDLLQAIDQTLRAKYHKKSKAQVQKSRTP